MSDILVPLFALLFFSPLAFVYGRVVAGRIHAKAAASGRSVRGTALPYLWTPALVSMCAATRLSDPYALAARLGSLSTNPVVALVWGVADLLGSVALILFFLTVPFVLGRLFAVGAASLGYLASQRGNPLRFGLAPRQEERASEDETMAKTTDAPPLVIAIDGPAAAGKGTLAKRIAAHYRLPYLDTGLLYRAVGRKAFEAGVDLGDGEAVGRIATMLAPSALDDGTLRGREAGELASRVAVHPPVRAALTQFQRDFAASSTGAVLDGRDIGTVICPSARVKIFVTASAQERARRRTAELAAKGRAPDYERILAEVQERDARDMGRADAPLRAAEDAHLLDTSELDIEAAFRAACDLVDHAIGRTDRS